jgi:hypothetical protein
LEWGERNGEKGMYVLEQRGSPPSKGFIPFNNNNGYSANAYRFNIVKIANPLRLLLTPPH